MAESGRIASERGIWFTSSSVGALRAYHAMLGPKETVICFSVALDPEGKIYSWGWGSDYEAPGPAIADRLGDVQFYWYVDPEGLEATRMFCLDVHADRPTEMIPLGRCP